VASVSTIFALVADSVEKEIAAESTFHQLIELLLDEFMAVHLMYVSLAHTKGTLTA
jgi:hypothetical protein